MKSTFVHEWMFEHALRRPEAPAVATPTSSLTYADLAARTRALAGHLSAAGVQPGQRVLVALPNVPATVVAGLALNSIGAVAVEVNREWGAQVLAHIVLQCSARHVFAWGRDAQAWRQVQTQVPLEHLWIVHPTAPTDQFRATLGAPASFLLEDGRADSSLPLQPSPPAPDLTPETTALILYTSGSTGQPRGVVQTFLNIDANTRSIARYLELSEEDRAMVVLPLYYCYGRSILQTHLFAGGSVFLESRFAFPRVAMETLATESCTGFAGVPLTYEIIRRQVDVSTLSFPRLRYLTQAGGAMSPQTIDWVREVFHPVPLFVMYGQTEATARLSYLPPARARDKRGSIGIPIPGVELLVVDESGAPVRDGTVGHLIARGGNVTPGYFDEPEETAAILRRGWLWTGDLALRDSDGFLFHQGRSKEILKVGGHRISPAEIEHALAEHPAVAETAVLGMPHDLLGEVPAAFVVVRPGHAPSEDELRRFCRERMPAHKVPARVTFVAELPRNQAGKLLRAELARLGSSR